MDHTDYKAKLGEFIQRYGAAKIRADVACYHIEGLNVFNLPNLVKTAEALFRLQRLPINFNHLNIQSPLDST